MTFSGLITTAGSPQWREGARPEAAPEPGETAHLAQKDAGSLLFRAGGGLGGPARGAGTGRAASPGPGGKGPEQRGGTRATAALLAQDQPALAGQGPARGTGTRRALPAGAMRAASV